MERKIEEKTKGKEVCNERKKRKYLTKGGRDGRTVHQLFLPFKEQTIINIKNKLHNGRVKIILTVNKEFKGPYKL